METKIEDGKLIITLPLQEPRQSASGKTFLVATTGGNVLTTATVNGQPVLVGVNAFIRKVAGDVVKAELA